MELKDALNIVLDLARQNVIEPHDDMQEEHARQAAAIEAVEKLLDPQRPMIQIEVDVDLCLKLVPAAKLDDYQNYYDARLLRMDGLQVQGSYCDEKGGMSWKDVTRDASN